MREKNVRINKKNIRRFLSVLLVMLLFSLLSHPVRALETEEGDVLEKSGAMDMYESLDPDTKSLLSQLGLQSAHMTEEINTNRLFQAFSELLREKLSTPVKTFAALLAVILLCRLANCFENKEVGEVSSLAGALACTAIVAVPMVEMIQSTKTVVESASVFLLASVPVYSGLLIASGNAAMGSSYSILGMAAGNAIPILATSLLFPILQLLLAFAAASAVSSVKLERISGSFYRFGKWLLILAVTIFSGLISVQSALNAQVDAAAGKTAKLIASSAIPIVGGAFGDAVTAIQNSVRMVKSGVGAFGLLTSICVFAPSVIQAVVWIAVCTLGQIAGELFETPKISSFLGTCGSAAKMVLAVLSSVCAVSVVCAAIVLFAGNGT